MEVPSIEYVFLWLAILSVIFGLLFYRYTSRFLFGAGKADLDRSTRRKHKWVSIIVTAIFGYCHSFTFYFLVFYRLYTK